MSDIRFVDANQLRFAFIEEGAGPLVLLLHGFPDTAFSWAAVRSALARAGFRAISPFLRGYFPTAIPTDRRYDVATLGRDVLALIDALGEKQAILVGHDWGAFASYAATALAPKRIARLFTVAIPHPLSVRPLPRVLWGARHVLRFQLPGAEALVARHDFRYIDELVHRWSPEWAYDPAETAQVKQCFRHPSSLAAAVAYYRSLSVPPPAARRVSIVVPCAAFAGVDDTIFCPADFERGRRHFAAGYEVVTMPGGHFLHREHPERFCAELLARLRGRS
jgi:pimeloyl-ACP methyl ester carboxylesterase